LAAANRGFSVDTSNPDMRLWLLFAMLGLAAGAWAGDQSRSYSFTAEATRADCAMLPQPTFEVLPSLSRSKSDDRLIITCKRLENDEYLLTLNLLLTDVPPALARGQSRSYSFRWGEKVGAQRYPTQGEFSRNSERCSQILQLLRRASPTDPNLGPTWSVVCSPEDWWGLVMEFTLTEASR
jgi:hypothetical protein